MILRIRQSIQVTESASRVSKAYMTALFCVGLCSKVFGVKSRHVPAVDEGTTAARLEAAAKLGHNHSLILDDILNNSGILRVGLNGLANPNQ